MLSSLVTSPVDSLTAQLQAVASIVDEPDSVILGAHLEGPFLSEARCGAQNPGHLIPPDVALLERWIAAAAGTLRMITVAPELPGALEVIGHASLHGVVAAVGHTDASYDEATLAFQRGATVATHLFNGMRPVHHREPGPVLAALDNGAACEVINDGVHVHPAILRLVADRDPAQLVLITDAIDAAGIGGGRYELGGQLVHVYGDEARLENGSLAGSVLTMDVALRRAVLECGLDIGTASAAASTNPARAIGLTDRGAIVPGARADLVHLDADLNVVRVMHGGRWV
jgi:N-acetylglucosamine-6-phosphate deacetylase